MGETYAQGLLRELLSDADSADMAFECATAAAAEEGGKTVIPAHFAVVQLRCRTLRGARPAAPVRVSAPPSAVRELLAFCYTGTCALRADTVVDVLALALSLGFSELADAARAAVAASPGGLLAPATALRVLDGLLARGDRALASSVLRYVRDNAAAVFGAEAAALGPSVATAAQQQQQAETKPVAAATVAAVLRLPWVAASEAQVFRFLCAWAAATTASATTAAELFALADLAVVPPRVLVAGVKASAAVPCWVPEDVYVRALEHHAAPLQHPLLVKHRDHGRLAIGHALGTYAGYGLVETLAEFLTLLPELVAQHAHEGGGLPLLARFRVSRMALGIRDGIVACGFDPAVIELRSATVDFGAVGEHSGPLAALAVAGTLLPPQQWPPAAGSHWSVNPTLLATTMTDAPDRNDRAGLFVRIDADPLPPQATANLVDAN